MSTGDKLCILIGPVLGFMIGMVALGIDLTALAQTHWVTVSVLILITFAGPNAVGLKYMMNAIDD